MVSSYLLDIGTLGVSVQPSWPNTRRSYDEITKKARQISDEGKIKERNI
jgi:hypothetical protein